MKKILMVLFLTFFLGGNFSYARRVKAGNQELYSYSSEELDLIKGGYVLIYDIKTGMRIGIFKRHVPFEFLITHEGIVVKKKLDSRGFFSLGIPKSHNLEKYPNAPVIAEIPFGLTISKLYIYNEKGELLKKNKIIKVFSSAGELISCCFHFSEKEFNLLDNVIIETRLDNNGYLQIGGRVRGHFEKYPHSKVLIKVHQGVVINISFLDEAGGVVDNKKYNLIYDENFNLVDSFTRQFPRSFLDGSFYIQRIIGEDGKLSLRGREIANLPQCAGCMGFIKVVNGKAEKFWIVDEDKIVAGKAPSNFNLESYIKNL